MSALKNSTVGIFGLGNIGTSIAKRLKGFEPNKIIYNSRSKNAEAQKQGFEYVSFDELLIYKMKNSNLTKEGSMSFNDQKFIKSIQG